MSSSESEVSADSTDNIKVKSYIRVKGDNGSSSEDKLSVSDNKKYKESKSAKRAHYSEYSDEDKLYSKKSRYNYSDDDDRNYRRSKYDDAGGSDHYSHSTRQKNRNYNDDKSNRKYRQSYVDLDKPNSDNEEINYVSHNHRKKKRREVDKLDAKCNDNSRNDLKVSKTNDGDKKINIINSNESISKDMQITDDTNINDNDNKKSKKNKMEDLFTKAGGAYIPPSKLRQLQESITDKSSVVYQRMAWEALKKSIIGLLNKVNISNIEFIVKEMLSENVVRGRGLVAQAIMHAQVASPTFTNIYATVVSVINTKFPNIGELILRRLIIQFRKSFKRNDKPVCINSVKFIGHLINQEVAHELLALEILTLMLHNHTSDSVEVAISFLKDVGQKLTEISPKGMNAVFEKLRNILHDSQTDKRVQYMIEVIFHIRKDGFKEFPPLIDGLDLVEDDDQITHLLRLDDTGKTEDILNVFKPDPNFVENEEKYKQIRLDILGESSEDSSSDDDDDDEDDNEENKDSTMEIIDKTETNLVALRRQIYLTIRSSLDFEECAHKMMKLDIKEGQQHEFCLMVLECCRQERSYEKFYGLLGQRFCLLRKEFMEQFVSIFQEQYESCHHLETNKLRNTAKFFTHLLHSDAITWTVLEVIKLNEDDTTSSSRIFIKILFQELAEYLGVQKLVTRIKDPIIAICLEGIFPRDNPRNTRFAINFFTAIGLGVLTDELREHLKTMPKVSTIAQQVAAANLDKSSSSSDSSSDSSNSDSSSSDSSESDDKKSSRKHHRR